ncbi:myotubularin-related protein 10-A-like [Argonauta hians]
MAKHSSYLASSHLKGSFTSFINGSDVPPNGFKSYVDFSDNDTSLSEDCDEMEPNTKSHLLPPLLPGERLMFSMEKVLKFNPFMNYKQGVSGALHLTNYKLAFITSSDLDDGSDYFLESPVNSTNEIPFTNVDSFYQVFSQAKKKKLSAVNFTQQPCKRLMIYSRDFKIHSFGFKMVGNNEKVLQFLKELSLHAFPDKSNLFVYKYGLQMKTNELSTQPPMPMFFQAKDWQEELIRIDQHPNWYVTCANEKFQISASLPKYFVIPNSLCKKSLAEMAQEFSDQRLISWSYSSPYGTSLSRMSSLKTGMSNQSDSEILLINAVKESTNTAVSVVDLVECCPSVKEIGLSGDKLKSLCMTDCSKDFWNKDVGWLAYVEDTKWLNYVQRCLKEAVSIVEMMSSKKTSVILKEPKSRDLSCLLSCLVQLLFDRHYRTLLGFQSLIQREWVSMGHPFQQRCGFVTVSGSESPVFLLFLDCVWQLTVQFPMEFEFSETYLTFLWDSLHTGLYETFLFNCQNQLMQEHQKYMNQPCNSASNISESYWSSSIWRMLANVNHKVLFYNPLYVVYNNPMCCDLANSISETNESTTKDKILYPQSSLVKIWAQCYIRWLNPGQVNGGGKISLYLQQCLLVEEILTICKRINGSSKNKTSKNCFTESNLIFGSSMADVNCKITSSFPFSDRQRNAMYLNDSLFPRLSLNIYKQSSEIILDTTVESTNHCRQYKGL